MNNNLCSKPVQTPYTTEEGKNVGPRKEVFMQLGNSQAYEDTARRTYTVEEIAEILGIGRVSAYELVKQKHFRAVKIGTAIRISKKSFDEWLDRQSD